MHVKTDNLMYAHGMHEKCGDHVIVLRVGEKDISLHQVIDAMCESANGRIASSRLGVPWITLRRLCKKMKIEWKPSKGGRDSDYWKNPEVDIIMKSTITIREKAAKIAHLLGMKKPLSPGAIHYQLKKNQKREA